MGRQKNIDMSIIPRDVVNKKEFEVDSQDLKKKDKKVGKLSKAKSRQTEGAGGNKKIEKVKKQNKVEQVDKVKEIDKEKEEKKVKIEKPKSLTPQIQIRKKPKHGKLYRKAQEEFDKTKLYTLDDALKILPKTANKKFEESIELHLKLETPKKGEQNIRGMIKLPHSTGKSVQIAALTVKPEIAKKAGAKLAGADDLIAKIKAGKIDFDILVAEPTMMTKIAPLAKILGPKGLMPNPKSGTISDDIETTIKDLTGGKVEYKADETGNVHMLIGKVKDDAKNLKENINTLIEAIGANQIRNITICSTMGPGIKIDPEKI